MILVENAAVATVDPAGREHTTGYVLVGYDGRIAAVGAGRATAVPEGTRRVDGSGCLVTPGLVNTHHHLYQWATRGLALDETLFGWLTTLYPIWGRLDAEIVGAAAGAGLGWLALSGCTTSMDHHYVFPRDGGDVLAAEIEAARSIGVRFHPTRGSMDLSRKDGGLPPDHVVEDTDEALAATEAAVDRWHDPSPDSMLRIAVAPCSPFSVTTRLMEEAATLARRKGVRLHTHLAETDDEEEFCRKQFGCTPVEYAERVGWLGDDVWLAHGVHLDDSAIARLGATGTGVAHCPSSNARLGAGMARVRELLDHGVPVGLGVDGSASQEVSHLGAELRQALYTARSRGGPKAMDAREALRLGTIGGARCLGRADDLGSLEVGKLADLVMWRLDGLAHDGIDDKVAALVFGPPARVDLALVGGRPVVERGELVNADADTLTERARRAHRRLMDAG
ncbi:cytosine/adenosine deaminase-related metal-dependent hydrolase [Actinoplanes campanulatus]|uniref:Cytosine/adenosine deaminase-related metal-dependent hydrolase n=1 Tax=Actinoplanes campanulatus TaxID=113559 RepID=A0A7W5AB09_9ACTN|nr:8-oxoguanine deaminase [Actinoplanes campanulatus]MBB3092519.1 cytosine/adenosine deaminase-related metal-dependent hydrolase [Actinoplanes campanulatus]GGM97082.1 8-oxoguanine deaminase [Actinoplanes campanulatus]GID34387.1 8-oxoguanine deaminase [Actinoplanes campanulatus]